ncbi:hypothetical protein DW1_2093 [Proteiniborus sp. DW1]|uniref:hypothetical protein n=1 Tax=Proteiniborus sp. DW1 TaxID=1889883 RepID=UPI00092DF2E8|nr:hypothetical protein [Proteiniborus sp. DW1]SCG83659.1 hypothetical protein DW1_2093 [Proteiniborus sp. DW1]
MNRKIKVSLSIVLVILVVFICSFFIFNKNKDDAILIADNAYGEELQEEQKKIPKDNKSEKDNNEIVSIEEKEKEIESKKPKNKIAVRPLKDASSGKEYYELEDAPVQYVIDGVSFKLKDNPEKVKQTKELSDEDIKRIQDYGYDWYTGYLEDVPPRYKYGEFYEKEPEEVEWAIKTLHPQRLNIYRNAIVGWETDVNLVYKMIRGDYVVSGVLQLAYVREDNPFGLEPKKGYERDAEFRYANTTKGLFLQQVIYLSDWREINNE